MAAQSQQSLKFSTRPRNYASLQKTNTFELGICMLRNAYQLMSTLLTWGVTARDAYASKDPDPGEDAWKSFWEPMEIIVWLMMKTFSEQ